MASFRCDKANSDEAGKPRIHSEPDQSEESNMKLKPKIIITHRYTIGSGEIRLVKPPD